MLSPQLAGKLTSVHRPPPPRSDRKSTLAPGAAVAESLKTWRHRCPFAASLVRNRRVSLAQIGFLPSIYRGNPHVFFIFAIFTKRIPG